MLRAFGPVSRHQYTSHESRYANSRSTAVAIYYCLQSIIPFVYSRRTSCKAPVYVTYSRGLQTAYKYFVQRTGAGSTSTSMFYVELLKYVYLRITARSYRRVCSRFSRFMILLIKIRRRSVTICETLQPGKVANRYVAFTHFGGKIWKNLEKKTKKKKCAKNKNQENQEF